MLFAQSSPYRRVRVPDDPATHTLLISLGIYPDHAHHEGDHLVTEWSAEEYAAAQSAHVPMQVLVEDLEQWYQRRNAEQSIDLQEVGLPVPPGFHLGSMGGYLTFDEVVAELDMMYAQYPAIISQRDSIGTTHQGRTIWMVKISDAPEVDEGEPEVLYNSLHHAREPVSMMQLIYYMHYLLSGYGQDSLATYLVREREMYFIPVVNPDGYVHNQSNNPNGGGMWRKNRRPNGSGAYGVDLNRNYEYHWAHDDNGSSPSPSSNTYRGPSPFSEPETEAIRNLCMDRNFMTAMSYHGYGEYLVHPWGYNDQEPLPDAQRYGDFSLSLVKDNHYYPGNTGTTVGYAANGVFDDWMYGEQGLKPKVYSFSPECGNSMDGFWPSSQRIPEICAEQVEANLRLACLAGACVDIHSEVPAFMGGTVLNLPVRFQNHGLAVQSSFRVGFSSTHPAVVSVLTPQLNVPTLAANAFSTLQFGIQVNPNTPQGTWIEGTVSALMDNGVVNEQQIRFQYGVPDTLLFEDASTNTGFWDGAWARTGERAYSGGYSITDSPLQLYDDNSNNSYSLDQPIDLTNYHGAALEFMAYWEVDHAFDYVQLEASTDGMQFTPLAGRYTWDGRAPAQPAGEPLYEGRRYDWVDERIDLSAYDGGRLYLRFSLISDGWRARDGFYFDDLRVTAFGNSVGLEPSMALADAHLVPNPSTGEARIVLSAWMPEECRLEMMELSGKTVLSQALSGNAAIDMGDVTPGIYLYRIVSGDACSPWQKWVRQ